MVWHVARKEILSTLRDRRAILSNLLIPLLILPVVMLGLPLLIGGLFEREQETVTEVAVMGAENLPPDLEAALREQNVTLVDVPDVESAVQNGDYPVAFAVPEGFTASVENRSPAQLTLYQKEGNLRSELSASKVQDAVTAYRDALVSARLRAVGLDANVLEPVTLTTVDASSAAERSSGQLAWLIPFFIAIWTLAGGQMTAIDATAGEKERGTLEVLLVAPIRRSEVVVGKFIATLTFGLTAALMAIIGYIVGGTVLRGVFGARLGADANDIAAIMGGGLTITLPTVVMLVGSSLLLAALIAALLLGIAMFARSFKEAQTYVAPLSFLLILPALGLQFRDLLDVGSGVYFVPILNVLVLMDDIVKGAVTAIPVVITWGSLLVYITLLLGFAYTNFRREGVIFRS